MANGTQGAFSSNELFAEGTRRLGARQSFARGGVPLSQSEAAGLAEGELRVRAQEESRRLADARDAANTKRSLEETERSNLAQEAFQSRQLDQTLAQNQRQFNVTASEARKARKANEPDFFDRAQQVRGLAEGAPAVFDLLKDVFTFLKIF